MTTKKSKIGHMEDQNSLFQVMMIIALCVILFGNIGGFFFTKNSTRDLRVAIRKIDSEIDEENRRLSVAQADFNRKHNVQNLQQLAFEKLGLDFSTVKQVKEFHEIV